MDLVTMFPNWPLLLAFYLGFYLDRREAAVALFPLKDLGNLRTTAAAPQNKRQGGLSSCTNFRFLPGPNHGQAIAHSCLKSHGRGRNKAGFAPSRALLPQ